MKTKASSALTVTSLFVLALTPMGGAEPSGSPDAVILGPSGITATGIASAGIGYCSPGSALPLACDSSPGGLQGAGYYIHDISGCLGINCRYSIWAQQISGFFEGFGVTACTDRDDSGDCTNVGSSSDDFANAYDGTVLAGEPQEGKSDYAHVEFCVRSDSAAGDSDYDNMFVFITGWAGENFLFGDSIGFGIGVGLFDVWVEHTATNDSSCTFPKDGGGGNSVPLQMQVDGAAPQRRPDIDPGYRRAWGDIIIEDSGSGPEFSSTYAEEGWSCAMTTVGGVHVVCDAPNPGLNFIGWYCNILQVTALGRDVDSHVLGSTSCYRTGDLGPTIKTPEVHGIFVNFKTRELNFEEAVRIVCRALPTEDEGLVAPYLVKCAEP